MNRRSFLVGSTVVAFCAPFAESALAQSTPEVASDLPELALQLDDTSLTLPSSATVGRYAVTTTNTGISQDAHTVVALLPEGTTQEDFETVMQSDDDGGFDFSHIDGVGIPDWPRPGASVTGIVDLRPGLHVAFDPFGTRGYTFMEVTGNYPATPAVVTSDLEFTVGEMVINLPKGPIQAGSARWHISNVGALTHELAVLEVPEGFTYDDFMALMMLGDNATPTPGMKVIEYLPVAAVGLLGPQRETWLNVDLTASTHYMAVCMFPDSQGMPHAMTGMYAFFDIA